MKNIQHTVTIIALALFLSSSVCLGAFPEPISEWKFDGNGLNEVKSKPNASTVGNAVFEVTGGVRGGYAHIPADTDWISIYSVPAYNLAVSFAVEFWFRQFLDQNFRQYLIYKGDIASSNFFIHRSLWNEYNSGTVKASYKSASRWNHVTDRNDLSHGEWHHVVYTKDASSHAYYLDGRLISKANITEDAETNSHDIIIGDTSVNTDFDEVRIYNQSLTETEVSQRYNSFKLIIPSYLLLLLD